jgi:hypothetical protein
MSFGAYGTRNGKKDSLGFDYNGGINLFRKGEYYSGFTQRASVNYTRALSPRWSWFTGAGASVANSVAGNPRTPFTQSYFADPFIQTNEAFDNRVIALYAGTGAAYRPTSRWTLAFSGSASTAVRRSQALVGNYTWGGGAEASYSLSRKSAVGALYSYGRTEHRRGYGQADVMTWMGTYARSLSKTWSLGAAAGVYRAQVDRLQTFQIDPFLAAIIGQTTSVERFHRTYQGLAVNANLAASFRKSGLNFFYYRGVNPGNGVFLTSEAEGAGVGYHYNGFRRLGFTAGANWGRMKALLPTVDQLGRFNAYGTNAGLTYRIVSFIHAGLNAEYRRAEITGPSFLRNRYAVSAGITFSPGEIPLSLW